MQALKLIEILLISDREKTGRRISFDEEMTIVLGMNDTGKSSLLKSLYWTFGADPAVVHPKWPQAQVTALVRFDISGRRYSLLRREKFFALFDASDALVGTFEKITTGLGVQLAELFDFKLKLTTQKGSLVTPPPAYFFLPFYVDQDAGWKANWSSFSRLGQLSDWRSAIAEYHTGLKPNEYYLAKAELDKMQTDSDDARREIDVLQSLLARAEEAAKHVLFDADLEAFREQIERLLSEVDRLRLLENRLKNELIGLHNERIQKREEIKILEHSRRDLDADLHFVTETLGGRAIPCPECGTIFENSFAERFSIAEDEDRLAEMLLESQLELRAVDERIAAQHAEFTNKRDEVTSLEQTLKLQMENMTLAQVIQNEGQRELRKLLWSRLADAKIEIGRIDRGLKAIRAEMKKLTNKTRAEEILSKYRARMRNYLEKLDVRELSEQSYQRIDSNIRETGSDLPRALLAYYFSLFHIIREYSTSTLCPLVIDSPNQQAQDPQSLQTMLRFINENRPTGSQVILGLEDTYGVPFSGRVITLTDKYHLLSTDEYESLRQEISPFLQASFFV